MIEETTPTLRNPNVLLNHYTDVAIVQMRAKFWMNVFLAAQNDCMEDPNRDIISIAADSARMADAALSQFDSRFPILN